MRIAVLSPGPSLGRVTDDALDAMGPWNAIIGVNRVPARFACSDWCFGDAVAFDDVQAAGGAKRRDGVLPDVFTIASTRDDLERDVPGGPESAGFLSAEAQRERAHRFRGHVVRATWNSVDAQFQPPRDPGTGIGWDTYSGPAALVLATVLCMGLNEPHEVVVFGMDMAGKADFDGRVQGHRGDDRWRWERRVVRQVTDWAARHRVAFSWPAKFNAAVGVAA